MLKPPNSAAARPCRRGGLLYYQFPIFDQFRPLFTHAFSTRLGGVSQGPLAQLNLGLSRGDSQANLEENLRRFGAALGFDWQRAIFAQQTHTTTLLKADNSHAGYGVSRPRPYTDVDGLYTATPGLPLLTTYADCTPLLFYAADVHLAATSHAGWRGTVANMAGATVAALAAQGADPAHIYAAIGPCAGPCCYQVDTATAEQFSAISDEQGPVTWPDPAAARHFLVDLPRANRALLLQAGLSAEHIAISGLCTICHPDIFYSHRVQGERRGVMAALVMLNEQR